jgi:hypothetical protein
VGLLDADGIWLSSNATVRTRSGVVDTRLQGRDDLLSTIRQIIFK